MKTLPDPQEVPASLVRYERKFVPHGFSLAEVLALLHSHPAGFHELYPPRYVNSVYFDTMDLADYHDHVAGIASRSKSRVRWYGPRAGPIHRATLERKVKRGHVSWKESLTLAPFSVNGTGWGEPVRQSLHTSRVPDPVRFHLRHRQPVLLTRYLRRYFVTANRRFRLTVDTELLWETTLQPWEREREQLSPPVILELKFAPEAAPEADWITRHFPFRMVRCSKYVWGITALLY